MVRRGRVRNRVRPSSSFISCALFNFELINQIFGENCAELIDMKSFPKQIGFRGEYENRKNTRTPGREDGCLKDCHLKKVLAFGHSFPEYNKYCGTSAEGIEPGPLGSYKSMLDRLDRLPLAVEHV